MSDTIMLDDALIHHMYLVMRAFTKGVNEALKPLNLYSSEWTVLNFVTKHDSFPQSDIAAALEIEGAAISKTLSKMEQKGRKTHFPHRKGPGAVPPGSPGRRQSPQRRLSGPLTGRPAADAVLHPVHAGSYPQRLIHTKKLQYCKSVVFTTDRYLLCHYT